MNMQAVYNGMTLIEIENNLPVNMPDFHKKMYLENCESVYFNEKYGVCLDWCELVRTSNFILISIYNNLN